MRNHARYNLLEKNQRSRPRRTLRSHSSKERVESTDSTHFYFRYQIDISAEVTIIMQRILN
jgi:hypothetical protein